VARKKKAVVRGPGRNGDGYMYWLSTGLEHFKHAGEDMRFSGYNRYLSFSNMLALKNISSKNPPSIHFANSHCHLRVIAVNSIRICKKNFPIGSNQAFRCATVSFCRVLQLNIVL
jgi:hypothetical protein